MGGPFAHFQAPSAREDSGSWVNQGALKFFHKCICCFFDYFLTPNFKALFLFVSSSEIWAAKDLEFLIGTQAVFWLFSVVNKEEVKVVQNKND